MAYTTIPASTGGGGTVSTDATMTGDGSGGNPLHAIPTFGSDTTVQLPNAAATLVNALELIASLTTATAGSEVSQWLIKLLTGGAQGTFYTLKPSGVTIPAGTAAAPAVNFTGLTNYGFFTQGATNGVSLAVNGAETIRFSSTLGGIWITGDGSLGMSTGSSAQIKFIQRVTGAAATGIAEATSINGTIVGATAAADILTSSGAGFLYEPNMAGAPTVAPTSAFTGKRATVFDDTNGKQWAYLGSRYVALNRGGKGTAIASAGTLTPVAAERAMRDYFHITGTTTCNYFTYTASDVYAPLTDGQVLRLYFDGALTLTHNAGSVPANTLPFFLAGSANLTTAAGTRVTFVMDTAQGGWIETARTVA